MKKFILLLILTVSLYGQSTVIRGRVFQAGSNEPIAFANVVVLDTDYGAATDLDGNFVIYGLEPGFYRLMASFIGFKTTYSEEFQVNFARPAYIELPMEIQALEFEQIQVRPSVFPKTEEAPLSLRTIGVGDIENNPGANRDLSKIIQSFPGVASTAAFRNDVIVRGGGPNESRFYLDGVEIPNLNHFATQGASGGPVGIINPDFIQSVDYYAGAFPTNRGNALSGVFNFSQKEGNREKLTGRAVVGASDLALTLDGPLNEKTSFIFSARRSYLEFLFGIIGLPFLPTYNDFQFKTKINFDAKNSLTIIGLGAIDQFELNLDIENPDEEQQYILNNIPVNEQWNYTLGAVYTHFHKNNSFSNWVFSRNMLRNTSYKYLNNDESLPSNKILDYSSDESENKFRYERITRRNGQRFTWGGNLELARYDNETYRKDFLNNQLLELSYNTEVYLWIYGIFGQYSRNFFNKRLTASVGMRMDGNDYSSAMSNPLDQFSPRLSLSYALSDRLNLNFNTGRYYQRPPYTSFGYKDNTVTLVNQETGMSYITSDHLIGGIEYRLNPESQFTVETFYKTYNNYPVSIRDSISLANKGADFGVIGDEAVRSDGEGRAYGAEFLFRYKPDNTLNINISYTLVRSEFVNQFDEYTPSAWDSKHLLNITLIRSFGNGWQIGGKWRYVGGLPTTPYDLEKSAIVTAWQTREQPFLDYSRFNQARLKPFHQLDLRVDKRFYLRNWTLMLYLDIQNVYNYQAQLSDIVLPETDDNGNRIIVTGEDGIDRYQLKTIENTTGTVLPSIGIMIDF